MRGLLNMSEKNSDVKGILSLLLAIKGSLVELNQSRADEDSARKLYESRVAHTDAVLDKLQENYNDLLNKCELSLTVHSDRILDMSDEDAQKQNESYIPDEDVQNDSDTPDFNDVAPEEAVALENNFLHAADDDIEAESVQHKLLLNHSMSDIIRRHAMDFKSSHELTEDDIKHQLLDDEADRVGYKMADNIRQDTRTDDEEDNLDEDDHDKNQATNSQDDNDEGGSLSDTKDVEDSDKPVQFSRDDEDDEI
jgi:hypothetical protein